MIAREMRVWFAIAVTLLAGIGAAAAAPRPEGAQDSIMRYLHSIVIPVVNFEDTSVEEAFDFLRIRCRELDPEPDPALKGGVNIYFPSDSVPHEDARELKAGGAPINISLKARKMRLDDLLAEIALRRHVNIYIDDFGLAIVGAGQKPATPAKKLFSSDGRERMIREEKIAFRGVMFRVVRMDPGRLSVMWKGADDMPMRTFEQVQKRLAQDKRRVRFLMNAGIFEPGGVPSGLWDFAALFQSLGCRDALFLDGDISQMAVEPKEPVASNQFGAMFVVAE